MNHPQFYKILKEERKRELKFGFFVPNFKEIKQNVKKIEKLIGNREIKEIKMSLVVEYYNEE